MRGLGTHLDGRSGRQRLRLEPVVGVWMHVRSPCRRHACEEAFPRIMLRGWLAERTVAPCWSSLLGLLYSWWAWPTPGLKSCQGLGVHTVPVKTPWLYPLQCRDPYRDVLWSFEYKRYGRYPNSEWLHLQSSCLSSQVLNTTKSPNINLPAYVCIPVRPRFRRLTSTIMPSTKPFCTRNNTTTSLFVW